MDQSTAQAHPAPPTNPPKREMVFCHECEDEWYRDEHGIICPECGSEFTEIIEDNNDPRGNAAPHDGDDSDSMPDLEDAPPGIPPLHDHNPWRDDDPEEGDISTYQFRPIGPGRFQLSATIHRTVSPADLGRGGNGPNTIGGFTSLLHNLVRGASQPPAEGQANQSGDGQGAGSRSASGAGSPQPHVHRFQYTAGARLHPRDPDHPEPRLEPVDDLTNVIAGIMAAFGEPPGARGPPGGHEHVHMFGDMPFNPLMGLFAAMSGGQHGDAVYSQEALDRIISQLMEQTASSNAPPPASQEAIDSLPRKDVSEDMLGPEGRAECSICMDEVNIGEAVTELPCKHWFHHQCIAAWLGEHDTCPHCRQGITKPAENTNSPSAGGNASSSGADLIASMPGAFGVTVEGTPQNPYPQPPPFGHPLNTASPSEAGSAEQQDARSGGLGDRLRRGLFGPPSR